MGVRQQRPLRKRVLSGSSGRALNAAAQVTARPGQQRNPLRVFALQNRLASGSCNSIATN
jgi:hypothetical protein